jgi:hypothetical protein
MNRRTSGTGGVGKSSSAEDRQVRKAGYSGGKTALYAVVASLRPIELDLASLRNLFACAFRILSAMAIFQQLRFVSRHFYPGKDVRVLASALNANLS